MATHFAGPVASKKGFVGVSYQAETPQIFKSGSLPLDTTLDFVYPNDGTAASKVILPAGSQGQQKIIVHSDGTSTKGITIDPSNGTEVKLEAQKQKAFYVYGDDTWHLVYTDGSV